MVVVDRLGDRKDGDHLSKKSPPSEHEELAKKKFFSEAKTCMKEVMVYPLVVRLVQRL